MGQKLFRDDLFVQKDGNWVVVGNKCKKCGAISFPKNDLCVFCLAEGEMEEVELEHTGKLYSYSTTFRNVGNWKAPFTTGIVWLEDQQVSLVSPLLKDEDDEYRCGAQVQMVLDKYYDDGEDEVIGYKFKQIKDGGDK